MVDEGLVIEDRDGVRILTLSHPPSNALTPHLRATLIAAIRGIDPACHRIILAASGQTFSSALPLDPDLAGPGLAELCTAVEQSPVPIIAALHGLVMGPGAELALAARRRIAAPDTRIAFPEIVLGLCPKGGSTLRLCRQIGAEAALQLLLTGRAVRADAALAMGLLDAVVDRPLAAALAAPAEGASAGRGSFAKSAAATSAAVAAARRAYPQALPATERIIACVEAAALLPPEAYLAFEAVAREDLEASPEAAALCAAARAERRAATLPPVVAGLRPPRTDRIALHGAGSEFVGLAQAALARGLAVDWQHPTDAARAQSLTALDAADLADERAGRLSALERPARRARLASVPGQTTARLQIVAAAPATPVDGVACLVLGGAEGTLGLALAPSGRLCELAIPAAAAPETVALAIAGLRAIGLSPILVGQRPVLGQSLTTAGVAALTQLARSGVPQRALGAALTAFGMVLPRGLPAPPSDRRDLPEAEILNRWLAAMANEGLRLLEQGIARRPSDIDLTLVQGHGFPRWRCGPMHQADQRGLLVLRRDLRSWAEDDPLWTPAPLLDRLIRDGQRLADLDAVDLG